METKNKDWKPEVGKTGMPAIPLNFLLIYLNNSIT